MYEIYFITKDNLGYENFDEMSENMLVSLTIDER